MMVAVGDLVTVRKQTDPTGIRDLTFMGPVSHQGRVGKLIAIVQNPIHEIPHLTPNGQHQLYIVEFPSGESEAFLKWHLQALS